MYLCSAQTVGVIVRLERESFQILNMLGKVIFTSPLSLLQICVVIESCVAILCYVESIFADI